MPHPAPVAAPPVAPTTPAARLRDDPPVARVGALRVSRGGSDALRDVDLYLHAGALTVLAGPNGAGKSTLVEVLAGVLVPTSGTVDRWTRSVGLVPQRAAVPDRLPVTVHEVVTMGTWGGRRAAGRARAAARRRVDEAVEVCGLGPLRRRPFATLSGGERQRALLAQGLARRSDLLLLDEPTTGLDEASTAHVHAAVRHEVARGAAVVCASHDLATLALADRVVRLEAGRVVGDTAG